MLHVNRVRCMPRRKNVLAVSVSTALIAVLFTGCAGNAGNAGNTGHQQGASGEQVQAEQHQPVTITVGVKDSGYLNDEEMKRYIIDPVKKKYPWITVERVQYAGKGNTLPELLAAGNIPDILMTNNINGFPEMDELDLLEPLSDQIKKNNMDLNRFDAETLDAIKMNSNRDELVGIPFTRHFQALYYNKDIFDKFGVPYPKDGMTWEDATELAKQVTRMQDGVQYRGLQENVIQRPASQLSLPYIDPKTNKANFNNDSWKKVMETMAKIHQIPGNEVIVGKNKATLMFTKERTLAMLAANNILFSGELDKLTDLNWDMVSMPVWQSAPGKEPRIDETLLVTTKTSKNKDDAFRVISTVVSDEVQLDMAKQGRVSVMKDEKFKQAFGKDMSFMAGKNINGIYKTTPAKSFVPTLYDTIAFDLMDTALQDMAAKGKDVNTVLREAEEAVNKKIQEKSVK